MSKSTVAVVGGGIGGIAAGIALLKAGFTVKVFERAGELREAGAGISLWPNGTGILGQLGVLPAVLRHGQSATRFLVRSHSGELLMDISTAEADTPTVCVHRAHLLHALACQLPQECLGLDHELTGIHIEGEKARLQFSNQECFVCDGVIGADGIHSRIRTILGADRKPSYRGYAIFRGLVDAPFPLSAGHGESWGAGKRFGMLAIGGNTVCWYATINTRDPRSLAHGSKEHLQRLFRDWHHPIPELLAATNPANILVNSASDLGPCRSWSTGPVTLLGDAAHALTPNLGQGACMALEDAFVLARCLTRNTGVSRGFRLYESLRFSPVRSAVLRSRWLGEVGQWENRLAVSFRNLATRLLPARMFECHSTFVERMSAMTGGIVEGV